MPLHSKLFGIISTIVTIIIVKVLLSPSIGPDDHYSILLLLIYVHRALALSMPVNVYVCIST